MKALSDIICLGNDLRLAKHRKASKNVSTLRSETISRWTALVQAQVNRHRAPTPVTVNGWDSLTCTLGKGGGSGAL